MNILDRILTLRKERGWTEYEMAERAGMTQSTISSWYKKNMLPSIPSLEKICKAFGLTLSEFFLEQEKGATLSLTDQQVRLLNYAARLTPDQYEALLAFMQKL